MASVRSNVTVENCTSVQFQVCLSIEGEPDQVISLGAFILNIAVLTLHLLTLLTQHGRASE